MKSSRTSLRKLGILFSVIALFLPIATFADNKVMGEVQFEGKGKVEKTSGVWVDSQYVGYLKELKGSKKVMLLPGDHTISVRQNGYADFTKQITVKPGEKQVVSVVMERAATGAMPASWAIVKIVVNPNRAAVFVDDRFVGHVGEFDGPGQSLQVAPGVHKIKVALPGYRTFETQINPIANQKVEVKTELVKSDEPLPDPALKGDTPPAVPASPGEAPAQPR